MTVYSPGVTPKALQLGVNGEHVLVNGSDGVFLPGTEPDTVHAVDNPDSWPRLLWHYRDDAWAEIDGPFGFQTDSHQYDNVAAQAVELTTADAVRTGPSSAVTMPFAVTSAPAQFVIASAQTGALDCLGYDLAGLPQPTSADPTLSVCRVTRDRVHEVPLTDGDQVASRDVGDGTSIVCTLHGASLDAQDRDAMAAGGLQAIADQVDASPSPDDPATWLPIS